LVPVLDIYTLDIDTACMYAFCIRHEAHINKKKQTDKQTDRQTNLANT